MSTNNKKGFTIIEVVLVLAIAGLIFLMVFIALPALQSSQRNTQREDDLARVLTAVNDYGSNNSGKTPFGTGSAKTVDKNFVSRYIDSDASTTNGLAYSCASGKNCDQFTDPDGNLYGFAYATKGTDGVVNDLPTAIDHKIYILLDAGCGDEGKWVDGSGDRNVALYYVEEGGAVVCNDNN